MTSDPQPTDDLRERAAKAFIEAHRRFQESRGATAADFTDEFASFVADAVLREIAVQMAVHEAWCSGEHLIDREGCVECLSSRAVPVLSDEQRLARLGFLAEYLDTSATTMGGEIVPGSAGPDWIRAAVNGGHEWDDLYAWFLTQPRHPRPRRRPVR